MSRLRAPRAWLSCRSILGATLPLLLLVLLPACGEGSSAAEAPSDGDEPRRAVADVLADGLPRVDLDTLERFMERTAAEDRVLVLDFWATWCGICVAIFDDVHESVTAVGEDVRLVSVSLDTSADETRAINFLAEHGALEDAYMLRPDSATRSSVERGLGERWRQLALPAILVFDREGELHREFIGEEAEAEAIARHVRSLVEEEEAVSANDRS